MLSKATTQIIRGLVFITHNMLLLIPIQFKSQFFHLHNNSRLYQKFSQIVWPTILIISLTQTLFEFCHFCLVDLQKNLVTLLYHGTIFVAKSALLTAYVTFNLSGLEFCQLFNAIFQASTKKQPHRFHKRSISPVNADDILFTILLLSSAVYIVVLWIVVLPAISFLLPCLHKSPLTIWFGSWNDLQFRIFIYFLNLIFALRNGSIGALACILGVLRLNA